MVSLDTLFNGLDLTVEPFAVCQVLGRQPLELGRRDTATIHLTLAGEGCIALDGGPQVPIHQNTLIIVPPGRAHRLASRDADLGSPAAAPRCRSLGPGWQAITAGDGPAPGVAIACGALTATYRNSHGLFDYLSEPIVERLAARDPVSQAMAAILDEQNRPQGGSRALCQSLMRQCLIHVLRRHGSGGGVPWLTALEDDRLGRAVEAIFEAPEAPHSLERLAGLAGMSRSAFASHFAQAFHRGPMDMVREIRLRRAAELLQGSDIPVKSLAHKVGYQSRSYFSRAFKEAFGVSPLAFRERTQAEAGQSRVR